MTTEKPDLFTVLVESARDRTDELNATAEAAKGVDVEKVFEAADKGRMVPVKGARAAPTAGDRIARHLAMAGVAIAASRMDMQMTIVVEQVKREGDAIKRQDPTKVRAITDEDIAASRAEKIT